MNEHKAGRLRPECLCDTYLSHGEHSSFCDHEYVQVLEAANEKQRLTLAVLNAAVEKLTADKERLLARSRGSPTMRDLQRLTTEGDGS